MASNETLGSAKKEKHNEYYTLLEDIENELKHYKTHFKDKVVLCNCDDPRISNFFRYFALNFEVLGLKKLIATCYKSNEPDLFSQNNSEQAVYIIYEGDKNGNRMPDPSEMEVLPLKGDGDFCSEECVKLLDEADIVCTNPPFTLFRKYINLLIEHKKKFLIICNPNSFSCKGVFELLQKNQAWVGFKSMSSDMLFEVSPEFEEELRRTKKEGSGWRIVNGKFLGRAAAVWLTNLDIKKRHEDLILFKKYRPEEYPQLDNFDAISVNSIADIPADYDGVMAVPISIFDNFNPDQFKIVGITKTWYGCASKIYPKQTEYNKNGKVSTVTKLNDGAAIKVTEPPVRKTYYEVNGEYFIQLYPRVLIQKIK